jgi:hypothetical protein
LEIFPVAYRCRIGAQTSNVITFHNGQWPHFQPAFSGPIFGWRQQPHGGAGIIHGNAVEGQRAATQGAGCNLSRIRLRPKTLGTWRQLYGKTLQPDM